MMALLSSAQAILLVSELFVRVRRYSGVAM